MLSGEVTREQRHRVQAAARPCLGDQRASGQGQQAPSPPSLGPRSTVTLLAASGPGRHVHGGQNALEVAQLDGLGWAGRRAGSIT